MTPRRHCWLPWRNSKQSSGNPHGHDDGDGEQTEADEGCAVSARHGPGNALCQCQYMMPTVLAALQRNPHLQILDVGCGSGAIAVELARRVPGGHVTGVDISGAVLDSARAQAEKVGVRNISFVTGNARELPFGGGTFDVVHTHQAVAHFGDAVKAIREMRRVAKKGGVICMREGDLRTGRFGPGYSELEECFRVIVEVHRRSGGAIDAGRRLGNWSVKAGVPRGHIVETKSVWTYDTLEGRKEYGGYWPARCTQGVFADLAKDVGVTSDRLEEYASTWSRWIQDPDASFTMMHGQVVARV